MPVKGDAPFNPMPKIAGVGKSLALSDEQLDLLIESAPAPKYKCLWTLQRYTASRISEALALRWRDVSNGYVSFRKSTTKTKQTRQLPQVDPLRQALEVYRKQWAAEWGWQPKGNEILFYGPYSTVTPITRQTADRALRQTCENLGLHGVSTHVFRRSLAQRCVNNGTPLRVVMQVTGHRSLSSLGEYLDASEEQVASAIYPLDSLL
jgi:integrase/recombinase XerD